MASLEIKAPKLPKGRIDAFDELKGAAILLIVIYHAGGVLVWQNFFHGDVGVDLFVILSGMGLALGTRVESAWSFLKRRLVRVMPAYWIVLTAYLIANTHFLQLHYSASNHMLLPGLIPLIHPHSPSKQLLHSPNAGAWTNTQDNPGNLQNKARA